jgi:hypothetical protein
LAYLLFISSLALLSCYFTLATNKTSRNLKLKIQKKEIKRCMRNKSEESLDDRIRLDGRQEKRREEALETPILAKLPAKLLGSG